MEQLTTEVFNFIKEQGAPWALSALSAVGAIWLFFKVGESFKRSYSVIFPSKKPINPEEYSFDDNDQTLAFIKEHNNALAFRKVYGIYTDKIHREHLIKLKNQLGENFNLIITRSAYPFMKFGSAHIFIEIKWYQHVKGYIFKIISCLFMLAALLTWLHIAVTVVYESGDIRNTLSFQLIHPLIVAICGSIFFQYLQLDYARARILQKKIENLDGQ